MKPMQQYHDEAVETLRENVTEDTGFLWTGGKEAQVLADMLLRKVDVTPTFLTVDTGNQLDSVVEFRERYHAENEFGWETRSFDALLEAINDPSDPRGYHGEWDESAEDIEHDLAGVPDTADEWTVPASCGALKTVPLREFIENDGYDTLVTGIRSDDPLIGGSGEFGDVVRKTTPSRHTRVNPLHDWSEEHVWAYLKREFVDYPRCYNEGYSHTDSECCIDNSAVGEHGEGGRDPEKEAAVDNLREMGYV